MTCSGWCVRILVCKPYLEGIAFEMPFSKLLCFGFAIDGKQGQDTSGFEWLSLLVFKFFDSPKRFDLTVMAR